MKKFSKISGPLHTFVLFLSLIPLTCHTQTLSQYHLHITFPSLAPPLIQEMLIIESMVSSIEEEDISKCINVFNTLHQNYKAISTPDSSSTSYHINKENRKITYKIYSSFSSLKKAKNPPWDGGFVWEKDKNGLPFIGVACQEEGPQIWWPAFDDIHARPDSMFIHLTVPHGLMGVSNGQFISKTFNKDSSITFLWKVSYPINNYNVSIYVGDYVYIHDSYFTEKNDTLSLNYYPLSYNKNVAQAHFAQVKEMLSTFEELFGPYPFINDGYKLVEAPYWGMEHQSAIAYGNKYRNNNFGFDFIIMHESAHEYWGNSVTMDGYEDLWIHETMATYTEVLFVEKTQGKSRSIDYLNQQKSYIKNSEPIAGKQNQRKYNTSDMYFKGSWMMHSLRNLYFSSDSAWFASIKKLYEDYKGKFIDRHEFIKFWENRIDSDLTSFFDQYLFSKETPVFHYKIKGKKLFYRLESVDSFKPDIQLLINGEEYVVNGSSEIKSIKIDEKIHSVIFSTHAILLDLKQGL